MKTRLNTPINTTSNGGYSVRILEIDPSDPDCFHGTIDTPGEGSGASAQWDLNGLRRDSSTSANLDMKSDVLALLSQFARHLGAK